MSLLHKWQYKERWGFYFHCPGCDESHIVGCNPGGWTFNGNESKPTFSPSILVTGGHYADGFDSSKQLCWCTYKERTGETTKFKCERCHSFVIDGQIHYLGDCSHALAGKVVDMVDIDTSQFVSSSE